MITSPWSRQVSSVGVTTAIILFAFHLFLSVPRVEASWYKCAVASHGISKVSTHWGDIHGSKLLSIPALSTRGGSESASAWNMGSRYDYRGSKSSSTTRSQTTTQKPYTVAADDDTGEETKEAIATAFLNREDRNRFIGETCAT